ncbi:MAG: DUF4276 family protein [Chloroflexota bacterium]|nr:DUF4276 family protein [Chloroflexota bacterium]
MHIEVLVEEESAKVALDILLPKMLEGKASCAIHDLGGKDKMLKTLNSRLKGYKNWPPFDLRVLVLLDRDDEDCHHLKQKLETAARNAGFVTRSARVGSSFQLLNRIAIEELEAWFFGDVAALVSAYPRVHNLNENQSGYRDPDAIQGGTWEALLRELQKANYYRYQKGLPKGEVARKIAEHMDPTRNRSRSFQVFREGLLELIN